LNNQEQFLRELKQLFWENNINPDINQIERLAHYSSLIVEKNQFVNLISRKDEARVVENHVFISALLSEYLPEKVFRFVDIGTGGGFPGIPLGIMRPLLRGVLVDSTTKKIEAVKEFVTKLKLTGLSAENSRIESDEFKNKYAGTFDLVVSRATVPLIILIRYALPLIKQKAFLLSMKGGDLGDEFKEADLKYKAYIKKSTVFDLSYKPSNIRNEKGKKVILLELNK
jgi:16S rRNA (guanine527-N7)-methyltransferase